MERCRSGCGNLRSKIRDHFIGQGIRIGSSSRPFKWGFVEGGNLRGKGKSRIMQWKRVEKRKDDGGEWDLNGPNVVSYG